MEMDEHELCVAEVKSKIVAPSDSVTYSGEATEEKYER
jgi:hypothetical protein